MAKISATTIKSIFELVVNKLVVHDEVSYVDEDPYWKISAPECFDMSQTPNCEVGSLLDDVECLLSLTTNDDRPVTSVDLDRLASLLNAISENMNPAG